MWDILSKSRVRYPPFESSLKNPEHLPIIDSEVVLAAGVTNLEETLNSLPSSVKVGSENSWLVQNCIIAQNSEGVREEMPPTSSLDERDFPPIVQRQRVGWYLSPDPIHATSRKIITIAVIFLLLSLSYQFIEPGLIIVGVISEPVGSIRLGILDYPLLMVIVVPVMVIPIVLRITANLRDLKQQKNFLESQPTKPEIEFTNPPISDQSLEGTILIPKPRDNWLNLSVTWRVGALPPAREEILSAHGISEGEQPPPGLSTPLPHYWERGLSDGTGIGEETPLERHDVQGGLFLRPMRITEKGGVQELPIEGGKFELSSPESPWPGSQSGDLVRFHWEVLVQINRLKMQPLYWLMPIHVRHGKGPFVIEKISVNDGRIEEFK